MPAGVAFDGSPWVTAASSVGLVVVTLGATVGGGVLIARKLATEGLPSPKLRSDSSVIKRRSIPLQKLSTDDSLTKVPPPIESLDD